MLWLAPVCTFTIVVGITLDYDAFLLVHVMEARYGEACVCGCSLG